MRAWTLLAVATVLLLPVSALEAQQLPSDKRGSFHPSEAWECQIQGSWPQAEEWDVIGNQLIAPMADLVDIRLRYTIISNDRGSLSAAAGMRGSPNVLIVSIDKKAMTIKLTSVIIARNFIGDQQKGTCKPVRLPSAGNH